MDTGDIKYLAGLLEGEGYFGIASTPRIQLKMTDEDIVSKARSLMSPESKIYIHSHANIKHSTNYTLTINGQLSIEWMMTLYSLMGRRRKEQIREVIHKWKLRPGYKHGRLNADKHNLILRLAKHEKISFAEARILIENTGKVQ